MNRPHIFKNQVADFVTWLILKKGWTGRKCENDRQCLALLRPVNSGKWESIRHQRDDTSFIILSPALIPMAHAWNTERRKQKVRTSRMTASKSSGEKNARNQTS